MQLPRSFSKPMGIAEDPDTDRLAVACREEVIVLANSAELAHAYPKAPNRYDALYMPRLTYHTGGLDVHDLNFGDGGKTLYAVNTRFSCLIKLDDRHSFTPVWQPKFIDRIASDDRCHLNGMAMRDGKPAYASAFSETNTPTGWRPNVTKTGVLFDVASGEVLARGLGMPHSPRIYDGALYVLQTAKGEVNQVDMKTGQITTVCHVGGFVRGMAKSGDYLFVGLSKLRKNSSTFAKLDFADKADRAGIVVIHLPTGARVGELTYASSVDEIYDVHILEGKTRPNVMSTLTGDHKLGLSTPEATYWARKGGEK